MEVVMKFSTLNLLLCLLALNLIGSLKAMESKPVGSLSAHLSAEEQAQVAAAAETMRRLQELQERSVSENHTPVHKPTKRNYRYFGIARSLPEAEIEELINACSETTKTGILDIVEQLNNPEEYGRNQNYLLLVGPSGVGKSSLGRAIAQKTGRKAVYVKCSSLQTSYQNSSSENLISLVSQVEAAANSNEKYVIILDEINCLFQKKTPNSEDASAALWQSLDDLLGNQNIFVIGTTNTTELPTQLETRFFDSILKVELPDLKARSSILKYRLKDHSYNFHNAKCKSLSTCPCTNNYFEILAQQLDGMSGREITIFIDGVIGLKKKAKDSYVSDVHIKEALRKIPTKSTLSKIREYIKGIDSITLTFMGISVTAVGVCLGLYVASKNAARAEQLALAARDLAIEQFEKAQQTTKECAKAALEHAKESSKAALEQAKKSSDLALRIAVRGINSAESIAAQQLAQQSAQEARIQTESWFK